MIRKTSVFFFFLIYYVPNGGGVVVAGTGVVVEAFRGLAVAGITVNKTLNKTCISLSILNTVTEKFATKNRIF